MEVLITKKILSAMEAQRIYFRPHFHNEGVLGKTLKLKNMVIAEKYSRLPETSLNWLEPIEIGSFSYIVQGSMLEGCILGRYCSIATGVRVISEGHPIDRITTSTITYGDRIFDLIKNDYGVEIIQDRNIKKSKKTIIGHDVWVGENSVIKRGINIGTGAIIAANAVVVKDVPPYAIVGGNPAKIIRYRFNEQIIEELLNSEWWKIPPNNFSELDLSDEKNFLSNISQISDRSFNPPRINLTELIIKNKD